MEQYIKQIKHLCGLADNPSQGFKQITIDYFQEFEEQFFSSDRNLKDEPIERDEVLAKAYEISILLDVIDRTKFPRDTQIFETMYQLLNAWGTAIENRNKAMGIPWHKG